MMALFMMGALALLQISGALASNDYRPTAYAVGSSPEINAFSVFTGQGITLNSTHPVLTLDYGSEVGGFPFVKTGTPEDAVQIELKYSEPFDGLQLPHGDGPW